MSVTEQAIRNLAAAFCKLPAGSQHRETYVKSLESLVALATSEQLLHMQLDFERCMRITLKARDR